MKRRGVSILLWSAVLCVPVCSAAAPGASAHVPVRLEVSGDDELAKKVTACLKNELQKNPDVTVVTSSSAITLSVMITPQRMSDGSLIGYLVYEGGYQPGPRCSEDSESNQAVVIQWQTLRMLPPDNSGTCARLVQDFTREVVEPTKQEMQRIKGMFQKAVPK